MKGATMKLTNERRGFEDVLHEVYPPGQGDKRLVGQSSAIGNYNDSLERPGSSYLWVGEHHHLNREEVAELRDRLTAWLERQSLWLEKDGDMPTTLT